MGLIVLNGNNIELLKNYPDNYFDSVVTDPPYGLGKEPDPSELMRAWLETGYHEIQGKGFMGKEWDAFVPQPIFWKEVFRVLKHGGHVVAFYGTRTYDWGVMAMRFAGFEVRDCIQWLYGSGFPKSYNVGKGIEGKILLGNSNPSEFKNLKGEKSKQCIGLGNADLIAGHKTKAYEKTKIDVEYQSIEGKEWDGWGSALKPANEPIVLARKPLEKGLSIAENVLKWGTGGINIDGCRVGNEGATKRSHQSEYPKKENGTEDRSGHWARVGHEIEELNKGRFPANIILTHHSECECKSEETSENWDCHSDCPIRIMDEQSGNVGGDSRTSKSTYDKGIWGNAKAVESKALYNDKGGASRFFYVAKASKSERNKGLEGFEEKRPDIRDSKGMGTFEEKGVGKQSNFHPTVKPVKLMQYLVRLITPPNGIVLDPFCGSGTTGIACKIEGFEFVGMEQDPEYSKIAEARISNWVEEKEKTPKQKENSSDEKIYFKQTSLF